MFRKAWRPRQWQARTDRVRVLVEDPDPAVLAVAERHLTQRGFDVAVCEGPDRLMRRTCPFAVGDECELALGADIVYTDLSWHDEDSRRVLAALRSRTAVPIVVERTQDDLRRFGDQLRGTVGVRCPVGLAEMTAAIEHAVAADPPAAAAEH
jgi:DNA-binding response OmpR family regulator